MIQRNGLAGPEVTTTGSKPAGAGNEIQIAGTFLEAGNYEHATSDDRQSSSDDIFHITGSKRGIAATQG